MGVRPFFFYGLASAVVSSLAHLFFCIFTQILISSLESSRASFGLPFPAILEIRCETRRVFSVSRNVYWPLWGIFSLSSLSQDGIVPVYLFSFVL